MNYNYHTHTYRCGHAVGTVEEYIKRAIECGIKYMGFSDHVPYICSDGYESDYRVPAAQGYDYIKELSLLREKYKNEIDIKIGFEMEYYPKHFDKMLKNVIEYGAEYIILGPHFLDEEHPDGRHTIRGTEDVNMLRQYADVVSEGIRTGAFTYVAHPDIFKFAGEDEVFKEEMRKICIAAKECNVPLEINFLGIRDNRNYPNRLFLEAAGEEKAPVTFGFDAHDVMNAFDGESLVKAKEYVEKFELNYVGKPKVVLIQNLK